MNGARLSALSLAVLLAAGLVVLGPSAEAQSNILVNGDFEDTTAEFPLNPPGTAWEVATSPPGRVNPSIPHPGLVAGSNTANLLLKFEFLGAQGTLIQTFPETAGDWTLDFYFAADDPGAGGTRSLNMGIRANTIGAGGDVNQINFRVSGDGRIEAHNSVLGPWQTIDTGVVQYSADGDGDDDYTGADDTLNVHRIRFVGHYDDPTPNYDLMISNAGSDDVTDNMYLGLTHFSGGGPPPQGSGLEQITLEQSSDGTGSYILDNMSLTTLFNPDRTWNNSAGGFWDNDNNWGGGGAPNANSETATFGSAIQASSTVSVDTDIVVKQITFDNSNTYAVAGTKSVTLESDTGGVNSQINVVQGSHQFQAVVNTSNNTDVFTAPGTTLAFNNELNLQGQTVTKTGDGTMEINHRLAAGGGMIDCQSGTCSGSGTVGGDFNNSGGTVSPGNSPGVLEVEGDYTQGDAGSLLMEIAGLDAGSQHDVLQVDGLASLSGNLEVALLGDFEPSAGDRFEVFQFGEVSGDFESIVLPPLSGGLAWDDSSLLSAGVLGVVPEPGTLLLSLVGMVSVLVFSNRWRG